MKQDKNRTNNKNTAAAQQQTAAAVRTDLALEEREQWHREAGAAAALPGVQAKEVVRRGVRTTVVRILNRQGEQELHKPQGTYVTLELRPEEHRALPAFRRVTQALAAEVVALMHLSETASVLVVGLGNESVTPDALGPMVLQRLFVTRHLLELDAAPFPHLRPVSALQPGVLGTTGMESFDVVRAVIDRVKPDAVVAVDALAGRSPERLCATVQLTDTGIVPGSGVGNRRPAFTPETLGLPVFAIGVPTVMDATAQRTQDGDPNADMILTPRSIDAKLRQISRVIGASLNLALQPQLTGAQIEQFVEIWQ